MFDQVKIILIRTTHPGNIGAVARAIKNMGFGKLILVGPKYFPSQEAISRASGAEDILAGAQVVHTLREAIADCHFVFGLSARSRTHHWPTLNAREGALQLVKNLKPDPTFQGALLFGQEQSGLSNEELATCHYQIHIPADPDFSSLNLAQAVQVIAYELRMAILTDNNSFSPVSLEGMEPVTDLLATSQGMESYYDHLAEILTAIGTINPKHPGNIMSQLRRLYAKSKLTQTELNILRGMLTTMQKAYSLKHD